MKITTLEFIVPPEHINKYLTHWTGRKKNDDESFDILSTILSTKKMKFSSNVISADDSTSINRSTMICFTDTPINQSIEHCKRYNYFGVSFNKNKLIEYGANPVLYYVSNRSWHSNILEDIRFDLLERDLLLSWLRSILQPYNSLGENSVEYFKEREWRIVRVLPFQFLTVQEEMRGHNNEYPFKGEIESIQRDGKQEFFMKFDPKIIENIIVPNHYKDKAIELVKREKLKCEILVVGK